MVTDKLQIEYFLSEDGHCYVYNNPKVYSVSPNLKTFLNRLDREEDGYVRFKGVFYFTKGGNFYPLKKVTEAKFEYQKTLEKLENLIT